MKEKIKERLFHATAAMLLSAGVIMPLLGAMDISLLDPRMLLLSAVIIIVFEMISLHRISAFAGMAAVAAGTCIWLFSPQGARTLSDFSVAVSLRIRGIDTAIPLISDSAKMIVVCAATVLCGLAAFRKATCLPSLLLCVAATLFVWLTDRPVLIPWLLPAFVSLMMLLMTSRHTDIPTIRVLPLSAGIVCIAFLLAGNGISVPPLKNKADELRKSILDRFFFTESRDVFSLYSAGFSPQGPDQLGGKPNPNQETVMTVSTPKTVYLRGAVYDEYTGRSWINTAGGRRLLWGSSRTDLEREQLFDLEYPPAGIYSPLSGETEITVRMECDNTSTLFVPQRIRELTPGTNMVPYFSNSTEVFITRNLKAGDLYTVTAPLYSSDDEGIGNLVEMCGKTAGSPGNDNVSDIYYYLPSHLDPALKNMALDITVDARTPFEKAYMIQQYLMNTYEYTTDVENQEPEYDFVTTFLMSTKKGYCTYFATAMTVLCRMNDLPSRYVEGYLAVPDSDGQAAVTGEDAHAWTEVYFDGFGWLTFDATPGHRRKAPGENGDQNTQEKKNPEANTTPTPEPNPGPTPEPTPEPTPTPSPDPAPEQKNNTPSPSPEPTAPETTPDPFPDETDAPAPSEEENEYGKTQEQYPGEETETESNHDFPWILIPVLLILMLFLRILMTSPYIRERMIHLPEKKVSIWIQEFIDLLSAESILRKKGETILALTERADRTGFFTTILRPAGEIISMLVYSRAKADNAKIDVIRDTAIMLKSEISKPAKVRYWIRRVFLSSKRRDWRR